MRRGSFRVFFASCTCALISLPVVADNFSTSDIAWLAGHWEGIGDDGETQGRALSVWTPPAEGTMSWTFRWHQAGQGHVHFAFSVLEETDDGVVYRGIHHGTDFETFEDAPWTFLLVEADEAKATFVCTENCRAPGVEFALLPDGSLRETWQPANDNAPPFVVTYEPSR
jgi:hypothetical protein